MSLGEFVGLISGLVISKQIKRVHMIPNLLASIAFYALAVATPYLLKKQRIPVELAKIILIFSVTAGTLLSFGEVALDNDVKIEDVFGLTFVRLGNKEIVGMDARMLMLSALPLFLSVGGK